MNTFDISQVTRAPNQSTPLKDLCQASRISSTTYIKKRIVSVVPIQGYRLIYRAIPIVSHESSAPPLTHAPTSPKHDTGIHHSFLRAKRNLAFLKGSCIPSSSIPILLHFSLSFHSSHTHKSRFLPQTYSPISLLSSFTYIKSHYSPSPF